MKKVYILLLMLILLVYFGCNKELTKKENSKEIIEKKKISLKIQDLEKQTILDRWTDKGSFWLLRFEPNKVIYEFNPSCEYWFPSKIINDEIVFYWAKNMNCSFDRGLSKSFKSIKNPELGKPFGKVKLINDSIIVVDYYYKDWIDKINKEETKTIDALFPSNFKKISLKNTLTN